MGHSEQLGNFYLRSELVRIPPNSSECFYNNNCNNKSYLKTVFSNYELTTTFVFLQLSIAEWLICMLGISMPLQFCSVECVFYRAKRKPSA